MRDIRVLLVDFSLDRSVERLLTTTTLQVLKATSVDQIEVGLEIFKPDIVITDGLTRIEFDMILPRFIRGRLPSMNVVNSAMDAYFCDLQFAHVSHLVIFTTLALSPRGFYRQIQWSIPHVYQDIKWLNQIYGADDSG